METLLKTPSMLRKTLKFEKKVSFISYVPFDFVGDFVQGYFSGATLSETDLPFVQVSEDVEVVLYVPQQYFLLEFE